MWTYTEGLPLSALDVMEQFERPGNEAQQQVFENLRRFATDAMQGRTEGKWEMQYLCTLESYALLSVPVCVCELSKIQTRT